MYVCMCYGVTDTQIKQAVAKGATDVKTLQSQLGVGAQCGKCIRMAREVMEQELDCIPNYYEVA
ncbi:bacterioferritin-associated ferredoxin [Ferrimonas marina]|uniref:Bacterioferritin-associated ferredoxin n=1 Tax=Ferrimonas marina TaxID=299255 RepID=A0A1M5XAA4_9GAMM|nr:bacterioferritin-associated ferredoxin [Ferrimonas marina]SHH96706.1 bacterioferritin-associated ferredoxin [Ferrimonas marina]